MRDTYPLLDLTGGAPKLNPHFRRLVRAARVQGLRVIDRRPASADFRDCRGCAMPAAT